MSDHIWMCKGCMPDEPVMEKSLGRFFAGSCHVCRKEAEPENLHYIDRTLADELRKKHLSYLFDLKGPTKKLSETGLLDEMASAENTFTGSPRHEGIFKDK